MAHPERENVPLQITAVKFQALYDELVAAQTAVLAEEETVEQLKIVRDEKADRLYKRLRATFETRYLVSYKAKACSNHSGGLFYLGTNWAR